MRIGEPEQFAIEFAVEDSRGRWVYGHLTFLVDGEEIGDREDATDVRGCRNWMRDFLSIERRAVGVDLERLTPAEFFEIVFDPVMGSGGPLPAHYPDAFERFSISHLGMSSFDRFDLLLVNLPNGGDRLLWREAGGEAKAFDLPPGAFHAVIAECVGWLDAILPPL